jgi:cytochrome P450
LGQLYWPIILGDKLGLSKDFYKFIDMAGNLTDRRSEVSRSFLFPFSSSIRSSSSLTSTSKNGLPPDAPRDIISYLLEDFHSGKSKTYRHVRELQSDGAAIIIAGSETLAGTLAFMFRYVAADPHIRAKLRAELGPLFGKTLPGEFVARDLEDEPAPYLNAVIAETLRIQNPAINTSVRLTPPEGIFVDGVHIPGGAEVVLPVWSLQRDERYFERALEFVPERWTTRPEMVKDRRAYLPFVTGKLRN